MRTKLPKTPPRTANVEWCFATKLTDDMLHCMILTLLVSWVFDTNVRIHEVVHQVVR